MKKMMNGMLNKMMKVGKIRMKHVLMMVFIFVFSLYSNAFGGAKSDSNPINMKVNSNPTIWISGYIASWTLHMGSGTDGNYGNMPYQAVDLDAMTHVIMFAAAIQSDGTLAYNNIVTSRRKPFNDYVHSKGKPVILSAGGAGNTSFSTAISATYRSNLVHNFMEAIRTYEYDGIDIDIEPVNASDTANISLFIKELYDSLQTHHSYHDVSKKPYLTCAVYNFASLWGRLNQYFDQINLMSYDYFGTWFGKSWHNNAPSAPSTDTDIYGVVMTTVQSKMQKFLDAGIPKNKFGVGIDFNGWVWKGGLLSDGSGNGVTAPRQRWSTAPTVVGGKETQYYVLRKKYIDTATVSYHYDNICKVPYIGIDSVGNSSDIYVTYQDTSTIREIMNLTKENGIGGLILWEVGGGYLGTTDFPVAQYPNLIRDPLLRAVKESFLGGLPIVVVPPQAPILSAPANNSNNVSINPLMQWNFAAGATNYRLQISSDVSFTNLILDDSTLSATSKQISNLNYLSSYYWRANVRNTAGTSQWSETWSFVTDSEKIVIPPPPPPVDPVEELVYNDSLNSPWNNASWSSTITLKSTENKYQGLYSIKSIQNAWGALRFISGTWESPKPITTLPDQRFKFNFYNTTSGLTIKVYFANIAGGTFPQFVFKSLPVNQWVSVDLPADSMNPGGLDVHYIVVQNNTSIVSTYFVDEISIAISGAQSLSSVPLIAPVNESILSTNSIVVKWDSVVGASLYHLQVSKDTTFSSTIFEDSLCSNVSKEITGLDWNAKYYWRVHASNQIVAGEFSNVWSFTTPVSSVKLVLSKTNINFGKIVIGKAKVDSVRISNSGTDTLTIISSQLSSTFAVNPSVIRVSPGVSNTVLVTFNSTKKGTYQENIFLEYGVPKKYDTIKVSGQSVLPPRSLRNPPGLAFVGVVPGSPVVESFYIQNDGEVDLVIDNIHSTMGSVSVYPLTLTVAPNDSQQITVTASVSNPSNETGMIIFTDNSVKSPDTMQVTINTTTGVEEELTPAEYSLNQNYPNPFNPSTTINYTLPAESRVKLTLYNLLGQVVDVLVNEVQPSGVYNVVWNANNAITNSLASEIYFYKIEAVKINNPTDMFTFSRKMILIK
ncbi:MAG: choice-of-anchor D domain-containing protein [Ignavibacteriales bacterium]|nr:choice-of-anchor D domain-containing protein [Ignavibacteriales bacterium]